MNERPTNSVTDKQLEISRVPRRMWDFSPNTFKKQNKDRMDRLLANFLTIMKEGKLLVFHGPVCTGKTSTACMLIRHAWSYAATSLYIREFDLTEYWDKKGLVPEYPNMTAGQRAREVDLLVVDDAFPLSGKDRLTKGYLRMIDFLCRERCDNKKAAILCGRNPIIYVNDMEFCTTVRKSGLYEIFTETYPFSDDTLPSDILQKASNMAEYYRMTTPDENSVGAEPADFMSGKE